MSNTTESNQSPNASETVKEMVDGATETLADGCRQCTEHYLTEPAKDLVSLGKDYAKEKPEVAAAWAFAIGVLVGWKIKP